MLIFRFEHKNGYGPYTCYDLNVKQEAFKRKVCNNQEVAVRHPMMKDIPKNFDKDGEYFFGCTFLEDLFIWFNEEERGYLIRAGFKLKVYACPDEYVHVEGTQAAFIKDKCLSVEILKEEEWFENSYV